MMISNFLDNKLFFKNLRKAVRELIMKASGTINSEIIAHSRAVNSDIDSAASLKMRETR